MSFIVKIEAEVTNKMISDQLVTAFEGGSNYWIGKFRFVKPAGELRSHDDLVKDLGLDADMASSPSCFYPLVEGYGLQLELDDEAKANGDDPPKVLNREAIQAGLEWLAKHQRFRITEIVEENGDADTADAFLQACVFNELVYG